MHLNLPDTNSVSEPIKVTADKMLTLILAGPDKIGWYNGDDSTDIHFTNYAANGLRAVIQGKKKYTSKKYANTDETFVLIKPTAGCSYGDIHKVLDEMLINKITRYMLTND